MSSNNRASLLSGLRTGGVRSASGPVMPHTAAIGGSFQVPRFASGYQPPTIYDEGSDELGQTLQYGSMNPYGAPMTASHADGRAPRFQQQQISFQQQQQHQQQQILRRAQIAAMSGMHGMNAMDQTQAQFLQLQLMQAMVAQQQQAQKLQAELALQQQVALALAAHPTPRIPSNNSRPPMTAAPTQTSFDIRSNAVSQLRTSRMTSLEEKDEPGPVPMTAALGGKFGSRSLPTGLNPNAASFKMGETEHSSSAAAPSSTVVISGGVSLGAPTTTASTTTSSNNGASKSDSAVSWRRGSAPGLSTSNSRSGSPPKVTLRQSPPAVTISSPEQVEKQAEKEALAAPASAANPTNIKARPQPLRINGGGSPLVPAVTIEDEEGHTVFTSTQSSVTNQPPSPASSHSSLEGSKKYEGLGIGRPAITSQPVQSVVRVSQPVRQPRGPPAGAEDLGLKNFAARVKRNTSTPMMIAQDAVPIAAY